MTDPELPDWAMDQKESKDWLRANDPYDEDSPASWRLRQKFYASQAEMWRNGRCTMEERNRDEKIVHFMERAITTIFWLAASALTVLVLWGVFEIIMFLVN